MRIFNLFKKGEKSAAQEISISVTGADSCVEDSNQTIEESIRQTSNTKNIPEGLKRVHNLILLDESGSMQSIYQPALTGVNETLQTICEAQKEHDNQEHIVWLVTFDTGHFKQIYANTPVEKAEAITPEQYRPCGGTPLYDAMGKSINQLRQIVTADDVVLVTVITDGYENASREYNGKAIKALVEEMKGRGWVFTYIGANQDVEAVAASMSIDNRLAFEANDECTGAMFERECRSRKKFFGKLSQNMSMCDLSTGYFDEDDEDEKTSNPKL